jgi:hypothetical protein
MGVRKPRASRTASELVTEDAYEQSAVNLKRSDWKLLRRVADARNEAHGGRRSVSAVLAGLIEDARKQLEKEAG